MVSGKTPLVNRKLPSSESSPRKIASEISLESCPEAINTPIAIGRSYAGPSFGKSAGARLTVILLVGNSAPTFFKAALTLSLLSSTALSGNPTILKAGKLWAATSTSTSIGTLSKPIVAPEITLASIRTF